MKELQSQPYERLHTCLQENQGSTMVLTATTLCSDIAVDFQENKKLITSYWIIWTKGKQV